MNATLVFPVAPPEARDFYESAERQGQRVVAANSNAVDGIDPLVILPSIYEDHFFDRLLELIQNQQISTIYSTVTAVHHFLKDHKHKLPTDVQLISGKTLDKVEDYYRDLIVRAESILKTLGQRSSLTSWQIASLLHSFHNIFGESSEEKLISFMKVFPELPKGDVVEIGCLFGKSFYALAALSAHYHIGTTLAVDPWQVTDSQQKDSPDYFQNLTKRIDWGLIAQAFIINLLPYKAYGIGCIRHASVEAAALYSKCRVFTSDEFGEVHTVGKIALLHIDGNHDYNHVRQDYEAWRPFIIPGGWMILDDYIWSHGDGPQRLGNEVLQSEQANITQHFVSEHALFIQFN